MMSGMTPELVVRIAPLDAGIGILHWLCRRPLLAISRGRPSRHVRAWDFVFYLTFGLVVTRAAAVDCDDRRSRRDWCDLDGSRRVARAGRAPPCGSARNTGPAAAHGA